MSLSRNDPNSESGSALATDQLSSMMPDPTKATPTIIPPPPTLTSEQQAALIRRLSQPTLVPIIAPGKWFLMELSLNMTLSTDWL